MMNVEMRKVIDAMFDELVANDCETCPFAEECAKNELFWGCGVWEEQMGEDL